MVVPFSESRPPDPSQDPVPSLLFRDELSITASPQTVKNFKAFLPMTIPGVDGTGHLACKERPSKERVR
jgi:hypothetical protein